ncbi:MAG: hypothetical protein AB1453_08585 [Chloroflexota bacterium]
MNQASPAIPQSTKKKSRWLSNLFIGLVGVLLLAGLASFVSNIGFPPPPEPTDTLSRTQYALLDEATHLRQSLGDAVFPGWGAMEIPIVVYNEQFAFLVGLDDPQPGWVMYPRDHHRGGEWQRVTSENGQNYHRARIEDPEKTPENFVVQIGEEIVASFQTHNYAINNLHSMMYAELPPLVRDVFPYRLFLSHLVALPEAYLSGLFHESFHVFQAVNNPSAFKSAELSVSLATNYPFDDDQLSLDWKEELKILSQAASLTNREDALRLAGEFLAIREQRRAEANLSSSQVMLERKREWLEGLAKYAELELGRQAALTRFQPLAETSQLTGLKTYGSRQGFWKTQLESMDTTHFGGETLFYYSGFAQAVLLDQLLPGWKTRAIQGEYLEDLISSGLQ